MKLLKTFFVLSVMVVFVPSFVFAERIDMYDMRMRIDDHGTMQVQELIDMDFGRDNKHGIIRSIPYSYERNGTTFDVRMTDFEVVDETGEPVTFKVRRSHGEYVITIGDADVLVSGVHHYEISYLVQRAITYLGVSDELFWNAVGTQWTFPIDTTRVLITLPSPVSERFLDIRCVAGAFGTTSACDSAALVKRDDGSVQQIQLEHGRLEAGSGMTFVVSLPSGVIMQPRPLSRVLWWLQDNWVVFVPIFVLFFGLYMWFVRGRDPKGREVIIARYSPPADLSPGEAGVVLDEVASAKDIVAELLYLVQKGYVKIEKGQSVGLSTTHNFVVSKIGSQPPEVFASVSSLYSLLFDGRDVVELGKQHRDFWQSILALGNIMYEEVVRKGYFVRNPHSVRLMIVVPGVLISFVGLFFVNVFNVLTGVSIIVSGILIVLFGFIMPARTSKGVSTKEHVLGLREYVNVAEKDRMLFHNNPDAKIDFFMDLLPWAVALGVVKQWQKVIAMHDIETPEWSEGFVSGGVSHGVFDMVSELEHSFKQGVEAASGKSGIMGGSVGGGFGGGGGSSW